LILQTHPAPKFQRFGAGIISAIVPTLLIPAEVKAEDLSHDPAVYEAYKADPLINMKGSVKGLHDMLSKVTTSSIFLAHIRFIPSLG
jgi:acylglycerol lipase